MFAPFVLMAALAVPAQAEDAPEFLLGDFGVRVDLPEGWEMEKWADWSLEGKSTDGTLKLYVWGSPYQVEPVAEDLDAWKAVYKAKVEGEIGGKEPSVVHQEVKPLDGRHVARFDVDFAFGKDLAGTLAGGTFAVEGKMMHFGVMAAKQRRDQAIEAVEMLITRAEVNKEPKAFAARESVDAAGVAVALPEGWRPPVGAELGKVATMAAPLAKDISACWSAIRPRVLADPDLLLTCASGKRLGIVDEFSFEGVDAQLRTELFPGVEVPAAEKITLADGRLGFMYRPNLPGKTLRMGVVPHGEGIARTWVFGPADMGADYDAALNTVMTEATYAGEHPVDFEDKVSYYLSYRPFSPMVLGPAGLLLLLIGGVVTMVTRSRGKNKYEDI